MQSFYISSFIFDICFLNFAVLKYGIDFFVTLMTLERLLKVEQGFEILQTIDFKKKNVLYSYFSKLHLLQFVNLNRQLCFGLFRI